MSSANIIEYFDGIVHRNGPESHEYAEIIQYCNTIHQLYFKDVGGLSIQTQPPAEVEAFLRRNQRIFQTTASMIGFASLKPHGYSGDFEIIERIYNQSTSDVAHIYKWDVFFHQAAAPMAVRNRTELARALIETTQPETMLSIGCGPGLDIREAVFGSSSLRYIDFVDNDPKALERAIVNYKIRPDGMDKTLTFISGNALRLKRERRYDLIWCSGLFDYLHDRAFVFLLKRLKGMTTPKGTVAIGNFSPENESRSYMELVSKWFLTHRTAPDLKRLARSAGFMSDAINIMADDTGVNLLLLARET